MTDTGVVPGESVSEPCKIKKGLSLLDEVLEITGYTSCGGCPGGNIEYSPEEMVKNGVEVIHLATGFVVGYPPCPYIVKISKGS